MGEQFQTRIGYDVREVGDMATERYGHKDNVGQQSQPEQIHIERKRRQDASDVAGAEAAGVAVKEWARALDMESLE
jgi:hypothetical protein